MTSVKQTRLQKIAKLIRYDIITSTSTAASGHPTTSLSAVELMVMLFFGGFLSYSIQDPSYIFNDRVIFSKGHAAPLLYSLYHAAGVISYDKLLTLRKFNSELEGHPVPRLKYVDVATGSLGQGLSVGVGMAMGIKLRLKKLEIFREPRVWILLGDSETAEGQVWEAVQLASYYKLNNLVGILDVNRLGQRGETMLGWNIETYRKRIESFGWKTIVVDDGHELQKIHKAFEEIEKGELKMEKPTMIIAKTVKGKGISFLENKDGWHGKPVPKDMLEAALKELGNVNLNVRGKINSPAIDSVRSFPPAMVRSKIPRSSTLSGGPSTSTTYRVGDFVSTREAYGDGLVELGKTNENIVVLDAETSNSTYAEKFKKLFPERFFEMFIAEQNMVSVALGISKIGFIPYASSFAAFLTRAFDQMRIAQYSNPNLKITGSHAGVSIGEDGPSQMALEDLAMARSLLNSIVLYPADAVSTAKLVYKMQKHDGMIFLRTTREKTPVIYNAEEEFEIGKAKILRQSKKDVAVVLTTGYTLHEALKAYEELKKQGIFVTVVDVYSVKPIDSKTINELVQKTKNLIVVEDHYPYGGLGEAVLSAIKNEKLKMKNFIHLCVHKLPRSGKPGELLRYEEIDAEAIIKVVKTL